MIMISFFWGGGGGGEQKGNEKSRVVLGNSFISAAAGDAILHSLHRASTTPGILRGLCHDVPTSSQPSFTRVKPWLMLVPEQS